MPQRRGKRSFYSPNRLASVPSWWIHLLQLCSFASISWPRPQRPASGRRWRRCAPTVAVAYLVHGFIGRAAIASPTPPWAAPAARRRDRRRRRSVAPGLSNRRRAPGAPASPRSRPAAGQRTRCRRPGAAAGRPRAGAGRPQLADPGPAALSFRLDQLATAAAPASGRRLRRCAPTAAVAYLGFKVQWNGKPG